MATPATATTTTPAASNPKGAFACFPFKFLFGGDHNNNDNGANGNGKTSKKDKKMQKKGTSATTSDTATASYEGSSMMSVDGGGGESSGLAGAVGVATKDGGGGFGASGAPGGVRTIAGYEIQDTLGKGMSGKVKRGYNHSRYG